MENYSDYNIDIPAGKINGKITLKCPECSEGRKGKNKNIKCLEVNLTKQIWHCHHCKWKGNLKNGKSTSYKKEEKVYVLPQFKNNTSLSDKMADYLVKERCLSPEVLKEMGITEGMAWMPNMGEGVKAVNTIQIPYYRGTSDKAVNVKYRDAKKNFKMEKGAERILYNLNAIIKYDEIIITEGEFDAHSFMTAKIPNATSVPNGASTGDNNLKYLDSCIDDFEGKKIILALDDDLPGRKLREDLAVRFGKERCTYLEFKGCKDANECLIKYGIQGIIDIYADKKEFPLEGIIRISDIIHEIEDMYVNGLDRGADVQIPGFDVNFVRGYLTMITGVPSHGKSDFMDYIALKLLVLHKWKGAFYSPENKPTKLHFAKLARKLIGKDWDGHSRLSVEEVNLAINYLDDCLCFIKPEKNFTIESILESARQMQVRHGLDFFVIDAWNKLDHKDTHTDAIGRTLDKLADFCERNNMHCFLVAHPTKMKNRDSDGLYEVPTLYNISGSSHFYNKTDIGICVYRDKITNIVYVHRQKVKFNHWGTEGCSEYRYDTTCGRYYVGQPDNEPWISLNKTKTTYDEE